MDTTMTSTSIVDRLYEDSLYSNFQNRFLSFIGPVAAIPSWIGSGLIIYVILRERRTLLKETYHRLILGLSLMDFFLSLSVTMFAGTWYIPQSAAEFVVGARAHTRVLCTVQGVLENLYFGSLLYTVCLMLYYAFILLGEWRKTFIARRIEPWMHFVCILITLGLMVVPALLDWMNPSARIPGTCFMVAYPVDCELPENNIECTRGEELNDNVSAFLTVLVLGAFLIMLVTMVALIVKVCRTEKRMRQYYAGEQQQQQQQQQQRSSSQEEIHYATDDGRGLYRTRATIMRALLYVSSYFLISISIVAFGLPEKPHKREHRPKYFTVALFYAIFANSQGTFNSVIYLRPRFKELTSETGTLGFLRPLVNFWNQFSCCRWLCSGSCCSCCFLVVEYNWSNPKSTTSRYQPSSVVVGQGTNSGGRSSLAMIHQSNLAGEDQSRRDAVSSCDTNPRDAIQDVFSNEFEPNDIEMNISEQQNPQTDVKEDFDRAWVQRGLVTATTTNHQGALLFEQTEEQQEEEQVDDDVIQKQHEEQPNPLPEFVAKSVPVPMGYNRHTVVAPAAQHLGVLVQDDVAEDSTATARKQDQNDIEYHSVVVVEAVFEDSCMSEAMMEGDRILSMDDMDLRHLTAKEVSDWIARYGMKMRRFVIERRQSKDELLEEDTNHDGGNGDNA